MYDKRQESITNAINKNDTVEGTIKYHEFRVKTRTVRPMHGNLLYGFRLGPGTCISVEYDGEALFSLHNNTGDTPREYRPFTPALPITALRRSLSKLRIRIHGGNGEGLESSGGDGGFDVVLLYADILTPREFAAFADRYSTDMPLTVGFVGNDGLPYEMNLHSYNIMEVRSKKSKHRREMAKKREEVGHLSE